MAERNMIREGFVFNTRAPDGTVSGSQFITPGQISDLVDENFSTTTLTISGGETMVLSADLGARWKIGRIDLYTDESSSANFQIEISENNLDFREITMTGSAGLWSGALDGSTIYGAPRYIRYHHNPSVDIDVLEWAAINDETLVDFGSDGSLTSLTIDDSPIGTVSTQVEELIIKNNFSKAAEGFIFIDRTFNDAEDELEIALSASGPWVGRNSAGVNQPDLVPWSAGEFLNTRIVPSGVLTVSFEDGDAKDWGMSGATQTIVDGKLRGTTTSQTPIVFRSSEFLTLDSEVNLADSQTTHQNKFAFRAGDFDTVKVVAQMPSAIPVSDFSEGPRLFWKTEQNIESSESTFRSSLSTLSSVGNSQLTSKSTEYVFNVASTPTWSGSIRGLAFQPFTTITGSGYIFDFTSIEVLNSAGESIGLASNSSHGEDFAFDSNNIDTSSADNTFLIVSNKHEVQADCIITKVGALMVDITTLNRQGICLLRELPGSTFPNPGSNFEAINGVSFDIDGTSLDGVLQEVEVFWQAQAGDKLAVVCNQNHGIRYIDGDVGASYGSTTASGLSNLTSLSAYASVINANQFTLQDREYLIFYEATDPANLGFKSTGTYRTPVFDAGLTPSLAMLDYDTTTDSDSSVDSLGEVGFDSVRARANDVPPYTNLALGEISSSTFYGLLNSNNVYSGAADGPYQINMPNNSLERFTSDDVINVAVDLLYHENNNELWVLNGLVSGTDPFQTTNVSLLWDVFDPDTKLWLRTDKVKGSLPYGYQNTLDSNQDAAFLGIGFFVDYTREEIYIVQRSPAFSLGAGNYYGMVLDLDGNYKDLIFRSLAIGISSSLSTETAFFIRSRAAAYAEDLRDLNVGNSSRTGVFFVVHDTTGTISTRVNVIGTHISAFRNGDSINERNTTLINTTAFSDIPGLGFTVSPDYGVKGIVYNKTDGRLYLHFDNLTGSGDDPANRKPEFIALDISFNTLTTAFEYTVSGISGSAFDTAPIEKSFSRIRAEATTNNDNTNIVASQGHDYTMNLAHSVGRDSFYILRSLMANVPNEFPGSQLTSTTHYYRDHSVSFIYECGAGNTISRAVPNFPSTTDALWGTVSGTLSFEDIASDGVNFPTGRYVQVEYQLNASSDKQTSPYLTASKIAQGLQIGQIPAGGSKTIYLRTNIPEGQSIGDQQGRLKVYWESAE